MNWRSNKFKNCELCGAEARGNFDAEAVLICASCVFKLACTPQEKIKVAYRVPVSRSPIFREGDGFRL